MDDAVTAKRIPPGREHRCRKRIAHRNADRSCSASMLACLRASRASAGGRVDSSGQRARHPHDVAALKHEAVERDVLGFAVDSRAPRARAHRSPCRSRWCRSRCRGGGGLPAATASCCRSASTADCMSGYCSLQASAAPSSERRRDAPGRAKRRRPDDARSLRISVRQSGPSSACIRRLHEGPAHRRRLALQLGELGGVFRRQQIGDGRHELGDLHQRAFEIAERAGERGGVRRRDWACRPESAGPHSAPPPHPHWRRRGRSARRGRRSGSFRCRP